MVEEDAVMEVEEDTAEAVVAAAVEEGAATTTEKAVVEEVDSEVAEAASVEEEMGGTEIEATATIGTEGIEVEGDTERRIGWPECCTCRL